MYTADLDNDGDLDILTSTVHAFEIGSYWYENQTILSVNQYSDANIVFYPNPAKNSVTLKQQRGLDITAIRIYDILGRLVITKEADFDFIDVSKLANGMFFVHIFSENRTIIQQLVKK